LKEARSQEARMGCSLFWLLASGLVVDHGVPEVILQMIQVKVVLLANIFLELSALIPWDIPRYAPWFRIGTRIVDHRFVMQGSLVRTREFFDYVQLIRVGMTEVIEPCSFIEADHVHNEGVAFPVAN